MQSVEKVLVLPSLERRAALSGGWQRILVPGAFI